MSHQPWRPCAICHVPTQHALVGNRVLSRREVQRLPSEGVPALSWRCHHHRRWKLRAANTLWADALGDLCCTLASLVLRSPASVEG